MNYSPTEWSSRSTRGNNISPVTHRIAISRRGNCNDDLDGLYKLRRPFSSCTTVHHTTEACVALIGEPDRWGIDI